MGLTADQRTAAELVSLAAQQPVQYGALFGLFCYATFELTNMALLKH